MLVIIIISNNMATIGIDSVPKENLSDYIKDMNQDDLHLYLIFVPIQDVRDDLYRFIEVVRNETIKEDIKKARKNSKYFNYHNRERCFYRDLDIMEKSVRNYDVKEYEAFITKRNNTLIKYGGIPYSKDEKVKNKFESFLERNKYKISEKGYDRIKKRLTEYLKTIKYAYY